MDLRRTLRKSTILRPPAFLPEDQFIEFREDPLTGVRCRLNLKRLERPIQVAETKALEELARKPADCPFCPENVGTVTPLFSPGLRREGYYEVGDCRMFPNLFPLAPYHGNITLGREHFLYMDQFSVGMLEDALEAAFQFMGDVRKQNRGKLYPILCWNYLPPSGGSIVHPHMQVLLDNEPTPYQRRLLNASRAFFRKAGSDFWGNLIDDERRRRERFVGENESLAVLASFAPQANREFQIVFKNACNLGDLGPAGRTDFISALLKLLAYYHRSGVESFNLTTLSAPLGEGRPFCRLSAKIIARPQVRPVYRNDAGILERVHYETDVEIAPEVLAKEAMEFFR